MRALVASRLKSGSRMKQGSGSKARSPESGPGAGAARAHCATGASTGRICSARSARPVALAALWSCPPSTSKP